MEHAALFSAEWWIEPLGSWMAWTRATAAFFIFIFGSIAAMGVWEYLSPSGPPRRGIFGLRLTRGDRLFLSLLGAAYIYLAWIGLFGPPIWWPSAIALGWAAFVFGYNARERER